MGKNRKFSWIRKVLIGLAISIMIAAGAFFWYVNDYYQATVEAVEALQSDESITVTETDDTITFTPNGKDPEEGANREAGQLTGLPAGDLGYMAVGHQKRLPGNSV